MKQYVVIAIPLTKGQVAYVDECDADIADYLWSANRNKKRFFGASREYKNSRIHMHIVVLERKLGRRIRKDRLLDHKNGNVFDNQRSNLREATHQQNNRNRASNKYSSSKYCGVSRRKNRNWSACINIGGKKKKRINLGCFYNEKDAARAYDRAALEHFGEYARLNFPKPTKAPKVKIIKTKRAPLPEGYIRQVPSGRFSATCRHQYIGIFDTQKEAAAAISRFKKDNL